MNDIIDLLPELEGEELSYIKMVLEDVPQEKRQKFANIYRARRKKPSDILLFSILGLVLVPGLQRFLLNQIGMGLLYFFTIGLCFIGSIIDLINHQKLALEYNIKVCSDVKMML